MPTTKAKITEQIQRATSRYVDRENLDPVVYKAEIKLLVEQAINEVLQVRTMEAQRMDKCEIPQSSLVTYSAVSVSSDQATLPAFPLNLENDMGVWEVVDSSAPLVLYVPISKQTAKLMQGTIVSALEQQIGFYRMGDTIHFLSDMSGVSTVDITLIVQDFSQITDNDPLPLSAAYELQVVDRVIQTLSNGRFSQQELNSINNREDLQENFNKNNS